MFESCRHIVASVLNGYNGTILAYGQTGSGKTHTLIVSVGCTMLAPYTVRLGSCGQLNLAVKPEAEPGWLLQTNCMHETSLRCQWHLLCIFLQCCKHTAAGSMLAVPVAHSCQAVSMYEAYC